MLLVGQRMGLLPLPLVGGKAQKKEEKRQLIRQVLAQERELLQYIGEEPHLIQTKTQWMTAQRASLSEGTEIWVFTSERRLDETVKNIRKMEVEEDEEPEEPEVLRMMPPCRIHTAPQ